MFLKILVALMLMISLGYAVVGIDRDNPVSERLARREVDNLRGFVFAVSRFAGVNRDFDGTVSWEGGQGATALRQQPSTPASLHGVSMPPGWRAVVSNGDYLLCAVLSEPALAILGAEMPERLRNAVVKASDGSNAVVFAAPDDFVADADPASPAEEWVNTCTT